MSVRTLGIIIVVAAIAFAIFFLLSGKKGRFAAGFLTSAMFFAGFGFMVLDRITEVTVPLIGTIKVATTQALADAGIIQNLKTQVEKQAASVDAAASQAKNAIGLSEQAASQVSMTDQKLREIDATLSSAKILLEEIQQDADFAKEIQQAQNDDRNAFDRLSAIAKDQNSPYAKRASDAWIAIWDAHNQGIYDSNFGMSWNAGVDPAALSFTDLKSLFGSARAPLKPALLEYINSRNDIAQIDKLDFFMEVMKADASLKAAEYAGRNFTSDTKLQIKPLALDYLENWWSEHRKDYENTTSEPK